MSVLPLCRLTGNILWPDGSPSYPTIIKFELSHSDEDTETGIMVVNSGHSIAKTDKKGNFAISLWPNERGDDDTYYKVDIMYKSCGRWHYGGPTLVITVPDQPEVNFNDLIDL